jgi:hypothetical protein
MKTIPQKDSASFICVPCVGACRQSSGLQAAWYYHQERVFITVIIVADHRYQCWKIFSGKCV